ncbi:uncharacterized protein LOC133549001 isoform X8 [Nerophis ophidion]|uniref:uncharacterized protein LOC133549001 isoform X8 n=1 Tax=Nerophis ophidion TaxID=159077 RepID=UPI002AE083FD|nr:uncharacterized protein LOC133549001 isoform X8 [Nerophis ophidion]
METAKKKAVGGKRCIAAGCSNTNTAGVSLFSFPKDYSQALLWNREVKRTRLDWTTHTKYSVLCSDHFERSCFEEGPLLRAEMGIATLRPLVLKKGAGPTIFNIPRPGISGSVTVSAPSASTSTSSDHHTPSTSGQTVHMRSAFNKRRRKVTIDQIMASTTTASVVDEPMAMALDLPDEEGDQDQLFFHFQGSKQGCQRDWVPIGTAPTPMTSSRSTRTGKILHISKDIHQLIGHQEGCLPPPQGGGFTVERGYPQPPRVKEEEDPQPLDIKEEKEDAQHPQGMEEEEHLQSSNIQEEGERECLPGQEEADPTKFPLTVVSVKTEDHEEKPPESSQLHHSPNVCEEGLLPEQQEWTSRMKQEEPRPPHIKEEEVEPQDPHIKEEEVEPQDPHIKAEEEEHSISREENHIEELEKVGVPKKPLTGVTVKSEEESKERTTTRHRATGFDPEWLKMPQLKSWLYNTQHGMFCRLCRQHKPAARKEGKRAFVEFGGGVYRKDYIERHITTEHHQESVRCQASFASGMSLVNAFEPPVVVEHEAVIGGFKCLYWLIKNGLAHHTNYPKLLSLAELLGCDYFRKLKLDQRNNYRSHRIIDEMLEILGEVIEEPVLSEIQSSKAITLEVDESTSVSTTKQFDVHVRYLDKEGRVFNQFLDLVELADGKAHTIVAAIKTAICKKGLPTERLYGLGTDGAAVMTGRVNGVVKQLTDSYPKMLGVACAAHGLALACKDSSIHVKYMATFRDHLQDLYLLFRNSANRTATLKAASITLGVSDLKIKEVKDTCWLSEHKAIENLQRNLPAVLAALAEEAEMRRCPVAKGLYTFCATYRFVAAVYLQADVLPHLASLSRVFQKVDVNFLHIKEMVPVTISTLRNIREAGQTPLPGSFLSRLHKDLDNSQGLGAFNIEHEEERDRRGRRQGDGQEATREGQWARFQQEVIHPYLSGLEKNLHLRFHDLDILGAFSVFGPKSAALQDDSANIDNLRILARKFCPEQQNEVLQEWTSFKNHVLTGAFKDKNQADILTLLASEFDEWDNVYPCLSLLAGIALVIPVSSVNCERDFSTLNRVKTDLRNHLQGEHLAACLRISINGPDPKDFPYDKALHYIFRKPREFNCPNKGCKVCRQ